MNYRPYAIACDRSTEESVLNKLKAIADDLSSKGYTLRSFGSDVPGNTVEKDVMRVEYFLPGKKFNNKTGAKLSKPSEGAYDVAKRYHPVYDKLGDFIKSILAATTHMVLGESLKDPILFLIVYSTDGVEKAKDCGIKTGTVSFVIKMTDSLGIPVINIKNPESLNRLLELEHNNG